MVITLRADFLSPALAVPGLKDLLQDRQLMLGTLTGEELRNAIVGPAHAVGALFEKGWFVPFLMMSTRSPGGRLPLLQHTLYELWTRRRGPWLTIDAYELSGGVVGALSTRAQAVYDGLSAAQRHGRGRSLSGSRPLATAFPTPAGEPHEISSIHERAERRCRCRSPGLERRRRRGD